MPDAETYANTAETDHYVETVTVKDDVVEQINVEKDLEFGAKLAADTSEGSEIYVWK